MKSEHEKYQDTLDSLRQSLKECKWWQFGGKAALRDLIMRVTMQSIGANRKRPEPLCNTGAKKIPCVNIDE